MPRKPVVLTDKQRDEIETLAALLSQEQIADYLSVSRSTFQAILDRDDDVLGRYKRGKARAIATVAKGLLQKARDGDTASAIFYLKTQAGWREVSRTEITGADGAAIKIDDATKHAAESFARGMARLAAAGDQGQPSGDADDGAEGAS